MFTIGDFARIGQVSVRMLHHYDEIGLLPPAHVDPVTGYRYYEATQVPRLRRILALKDLGFTLEQVHAIVDEDVTVEQLRGMLRMRRAELTAQLADGHDRLARVEARLRVIESEDRVPTYDIVTKRVDPVRVAELSAPVAGFGEELGRVLPSLYGELESKLTAAGLHATGFSIAYYEDAPNGDGIIAHAAFPIDDGAAGEHGFNVVELPPLEQAAALVHRGSMDAVGPSYEALLRWVDEYGRRPLGYSREVYLDCPPQEPDRWVTELQIPFAHDA